MILLAWGGAQPSLYFKAPQMILMCSEGGRVADLVHGLVAVDSDHQGPEPSLVGLCSQGGRIKI